MTTVSQATKLPPASPPIADQCTYLGVEISKDCSWDEHIAKVMGKGISQVGKMDAIIADPYLGTRIKNMYSD